jgi:hypothetical protein
MEEAMAAEGLKLERYLGREDRAQVRAGDEAADPPPARGSHRRGREPMPPHVRFTTYTLRYHKMEWLTIDALEQHWERADIDAQLVD